MKLDIGKLRTDGGTQSRERLDDAVVEEYAAAMRAGVEFPAVVAFHDGAVYWMADGFHRVAGAKQASIACLECEVRQGDRRAAILYSVGANGDHGLRRTNADKRRGVMVLLGDEEWSGKSDRWIAEKCGVGYTLVASLRQVPAAGTSSPANSQSRTGRDGKEYPPKKPRKTAASATAVTPDPERADDETIPTNDDEDDLPIVEGDESPDESPTNHAPNWNPPLAASLESNDAVFASGKLVVMVQRWRKELASAVSELAPHLRAAALERSTDHFVALVSDIVEHVPKLKSAGSGGQPVMQLIRGGKT